MKGRTKRALLIGAGVLLLAVIVLANVGRGKEKTVGVQVADAAVGDLHATVRAPGKIQPETSVKLSANVAGEVVRLAVREGDPVRKGQFLLQIDDAQYKAQVRQSRAALDAARSNLRLSEVALEQSESAHRRKESLFAQKLVSPEELEMARTQRNSDRARVDTNREEVTRAEAAHQAAEDNLRKTVFTSPIDGIVTQLNIERGEIVVVGTMNNPGTVILSVADLSRMKIEADVDETDVAAIRLGQPVTIKVDALPDTALTGVVTEIANSPKISDEGMQEQQINFEVDARIDRPPPTLRPGMTADVEIRTAARTGVLHVPIQAVVVRTAEELERAAKAKGRRGRSGTEARAAPAQAGGGTKKGKEEEIKGVFVLARGVAEFRRVKTGIASDTDIEVAGQLKAGEKVVSGPNKVLRTLKPGSRLKIETPKAPRSEKS